MRIHSVRMLLVATAATALAACGGGGGVNSTPYVGPSHTQPPPPPPPPPPPTPPAPSLAGVTGSQEFETVGADLRIRWDADANTYEVMLPGTSWAAMVPTTYGNYDLVADGVTVGTADFWKTGEYSYTRAAFVFPADGSDRQRVVFGIPTAASAIPVSGSANYFANVTGSGGGLSIFGTSELTFNFAAGTLSGYMSISGNDPAGWGPYPLGRYDFVNTVYSSGSTSFSGDLLNAANSYGGSFGGLFTGPMAQELMGQWQLQFAGPYFTSSASGVLIGKKSP